MSVTTMTRLTITLPADTAERLDAFARDTDRSVSGVVRFALRPLLNETPSLHHRGSPAGEAEPPGAGSRQPVPRLAPMEQHLKRVAETSRRQAAEAQAGRDTAFAQSAKYIADLGTSE